MTNDEMSLALKLARRPSGRVITITFENGTKQVIRPSLAFNGSVSEMTSTVAGNVPYKVKS